MEIPSKKYTKHFGIPGKFVFSGNFRKCDPICLWKFLEVKTGIVALMESGHTLTTMKSHI